MRLLAHEHQQILELLLVYNQEGNHQLVKRKGWVFVEINGQSYSFHRKKMTTLVDGQFTDQLVYYVKDGGEVEKVESFEEVLESMKQWLAEMKK